MKSRSLSLRLMLIPLVQLGSSALASVLCEKEQGVFSAKLYAGSQIFTQSPSPSSSYGSSSTISSLTSQNVYRDKSYTDTTATISSTNGPLAGGELVYKLPRSRFSLGVGYTYSSFDSTITSKYSATTNTTATLDPSITTVYGVNYQSTTTHQSTQTFDESTIRLSGYYDLSKKEWPIKPYAIAAFVATNTRSNGYSMNLTNYSYNTKNSEGSAASRSGTASPNDNYTTTNGTSSAWSYNPEIGIGLDVPLAKSLSLGSELRYIPRNTDSTMPILALGYLKYNFSSPSSPSSAIGCEALEVNVKSAAAVKALLQEATLNDLNELTQYLKKKKEMNAPINR